MAQESSRLSERTPRKRGGQSRKRQRPSSSRSSIAVADHDPHIHAGRVKIADITIDSKHRSLDRKAVNEISQSMREIGLNTPITVRPIGDKTALVSGRHRVEAAKLLGWEWIDAVYMHADDRQTRLWQIAENLHRVDLTVLERDAQIVEWLMLIDDGPGVSGQVVRKPQGGRPEGGVSLAARRLPVAGRSEAARRKSVERAISVDSIARRAKSAAVALGLDNNQTALLAVAKQPTPEAQVEKVRELASRRPTSRAARAAFATMAAHASKGDTETPSGAGWSTEEEASFTWLTTAWRRASELVVAWAKAPSRVRDRFISEVLCGRDADASDANDKANATHVSAHDRTTRSGQLELSAGGKSCL